MKKFQEKFSLNITFFAFWVDFIFSPKELLYQEKKTLHSFIIQGCCVQQTKSLSGQNKDNINPINPMIKYLKILLKQRPTRQVC